MSLMGAKQTEMNCYTGSLYRIMVKPFDTGQEQMRLHNILVIKERSVKKKNCH